MFLRQDRDTTGVYSRSGISGTGTTGRVVKMRLPGSISRAAAVTTIRSGRVEICIDASQASGPEPIQFRECELAVEVLDVVPDVEN